MVSEVSIGLWSVLEVVAALIACCIPTLRTLLAKQKWFPWRDSAPSSERPSDIVVTSRRIHRRRSPDDTLLETKNSAHHVMAESESELRGSDDYA